MLSVQRLVRPVFRVSLYKVIVLATALFSLLSFANAEQFRLSVLEEATHYAAGDDFIGSRIAQDDDTDVSHYEHRNHASVTQQSPVSAKTPEIASASYILHEIRGPPALAVIP